MVGMKCLQGCSSGYESLNVGSMWMKHTVEILGERFSPHCPHCDLHSFTHPINNADWSSTPEDKRFTDPFTVITVNNFVDWKEK